MIEKRIEIVLFTPSKTTVKKSVELYEYNSFGSLARKLSYVEGEEATNGIDIEEHVYDKNGNEIRAIKYNSLDPSSKFYTEREYDENGRVLCELDSTGKYKTSYEYENGTPTVSNEIYPNGSCLSYGYSDLDGSSAISISTRHGEENSGRQGNGSLSPRTVFRKQTKRLLFVRAPAGCAKLAINK